MEIITQCQTHFIEREKIISFPSSTTERQKHSVSISQSEIKLGTDFQIESQPVTTQHVTTIWVV